MKKRATPAENRTAALRAARLAADAAAEPAIAEWFEQAILAAKAKKVPLGRLHMTVRARGFAGTMAHYIRCTSTENSPLAKMAALELLQWSFEAGVVKFAEYFTRHFGAGVVAIAQARLAAFS
jgi:hypothetical protein